MTRREVERALRKQGCAADSASSGRGPHEKWVCPCGQHMVPIPRHREIKARVVEDIVAKMECLPEGWLR